MLNLCLVLQDQNPHTKACFNRALKMDLMNAQFVQNPPWLKLSQATMLKPGINTNSRLLCLWYDLQGPNRHNRAYIIHIGRGKLGLNVPTSAA